MKKSLTQQAREVRARLRDLTTAGVEGIECALLGTKNPDEIRLLKLVRKELDDRKIPADLRLALAMADAMIDELS